MKRHVVLLCTLILLTAIPALAEDRTDAQATLARDVVRMWDADIGGATILAFVRQHAGNVTFTADDVLMFREAGMSERVIRDLLDATSGVSPSRRAYRYDSPAYYPRYYPSAYPWWYYGGPYLDIHVGGHFGGHYNQHHYGFGHGGLGHGFVGGHSFSRVHSTGGGHFFSRGHSSGGHGSSRSHSSGGHSGGHRGGHSGGGHSGGHGRH